MEERAIDSSSNDSIRDNSRSLVQGRIRRAPAWIEDYVCAEEERNNFVLFNSVSGDPVSFEEAVKSVKWRKTMDLEIKAIEKTETSELIALPDGAKEIGVKWIFKTKLNENGEVDKYEARLVAKGYIQQFGVDYTEVFSPVAH